ncbi:stage III sporulation protein AA [Alteribacillus persepolensis]|uniref:Stage III sporulation protein AA n=1 Tax=Alteribacillus persepolensis TaxID=568899 RepID=A0A1G8CZ56_9BACI|nr:stage III sporulation protein AA [Alteribacillus persepolensis]SDH50798.1 stage III sporulation protein AA [Alteribacillus persepolensis]
MDDILALFPEHIQQMLHSAADWSVIEEIRVRIHSPLEIITQDSVYQLHEQLHISQEDIEYIINQLSEFSMYAFQEELKQGFITTRGGHRVGIGGQVVHENGKVISVKHIRYCNMRIAKDHYGTAGKYVSALYKNGYDDTLIIGAPQSGKTTFLRDLARCASEGIPELHLSSKKVGIVDERSEIAACYQGIPSFYVGNRTDVLDGCPKAVGMMMMIRSMSPEVMIVDEIGRQEDAEAIMEAVHAGVTVVCSAHGTSIQEVKKRPILKELVEQGTFRHIVTLSRKQGKQHVHITSSSDTKAAGI